MLEKQQWEEYQVYLRSLSAEELKIELQWLETMGKAKKNGATISSMQTDTLQ
jgi:hypothetical protein